LLSMNSILFLPNNIFFFTRFTFIHSDHLGRYCMCGWLRVSLFRWPQTNQFTLSSVSTQYPMGHSFLAMARSLQTTPTTCGEFPALWSSFALRATMVGRFVLVQFLNVVWFFHFLSFILLFLWSNFSIIVC
jgi:hypothetical protein